jgi:hypothetical protein
VHDGIGFGIEFLIQFSPPPIPFGDREDDASSINLPHVINRLVETGKRRQLHPSRHVASNISSCLGIVAVVVLPGVLDQNDSWCDFQYRSKRPECEHLFRDVPRELLHLRSYVT